jgi:hypothetical protein
MSMIFGMSAAMQQQQQQGAAAAAVPARGAGRGMGRGRGGQGGQRNVGAASMEFASPDEAAAALGDAALYAAAEDLAMPPLMFYDGLFPPGAGSRDDGY